MREELLLRKETLETELQEIKKQLNLVSPEPVELSTLLLFVSELSGVSVEKIVNEGRQAEPVRARHCFMYVARKVCGYSLKEIGDKLNNRDHSTVIHGVSKFLNYLETPKMAPLEHKLYQSVIKRLEDYERFINTPS